MAKNSEGPEKDSRWNTGEKFKGVLAKSNERAKGELWMR